MRRAGKLIANVDTKTFRVRDRAAVGASHGATTSDDAAIPGALWLAVAIALLAGVLLTRRAGRRRVAHS